MSDLKFVEVKEYPQEDGAYLWNGNKIVIKNGQLFEEWTASGSHRKNFSFYQHYAFYLEKTKDDFDYNLTTSPLSTLGKTIISTAFASDMFS